MSKLREIARQVTLKEAMNNEWIPLELSVAKHFIHDDEVSIRYYYSHSGKSTKRKLKIRIGSHVVKRLKWIIPIRLTVFTSKVDISVITLVPVEAGGRIFDLPSPKSRGGEVIFPFNSTLSITDQATKLTEYEIDENKLILRIL
jgi:hypothetical protein